VFSVIALEAFSEQEEFTQTRTCHSDAVHAEASAAEAEGWQGLLGEMVVFAITDL
jgi:hypothetical protein